MNPWDRLDEETPAPWRAFQAFLALPDRPRSLAAAQSALQTEANKAYTIPTLETWSAEFVWSERAQAYDEWLATRRHEAIGDEHAKQGAKIARDQLRVLSRALRVADRGLAEILGERDPDVKPLAGPVSAQALRGLMREAVVLSRLILGEATERVEEKSVDLTKLSDERLAELEAIVAEAKGDK